MRHLLLLFLLVPFFGFGQELKVLRLEYPTATIDMHTAEALSISLADISKKDNPTLMAYKGALLTIKAKFSKSVKNKKSYFTSGKALLENAISKAPHNIEIRCLRLGVQENSPKIVKYKAHIAEDKQFLLDHYPSTQNQEIKDFVKGFVRNSVLFNASEKTLF